MTWNPDEDGITHINIYTRGKTPLGRFLTNLTFAPFKHPVHGEFSCVEGFWFWLSTGKQHEALRQMGGFEAKTWAKKQDKVPMDPEEFEREVKSAISAKLRAYPAMLNQLIDSTLPLTHYYNYHGKVVEAGYEWLVEHHEYIRRACQDKGWRANEARRTE